MLRIVTDTTRVEAPADEVYEFLTDPANIELLLPEEAYRDFQSDENGCSFKATGGILIPLIYEHKVQNERIDLKSNKKAPFDYTLSIFIDDFGNHTEGHFEFEGDVGIFLKMMVQKPLENLFRTMTEKLQAQFEID